MGPPTAYWQSIRQAVWRRASGKLGLLGAAVLLALAAAAPALASSLPLLREDAGLLWSPLLVSLLDSHIYPRALDRLFNCLLLAGGTFLLALPVLGFVRTVLMPHVREFWLAASSFFLLAGVTLFLLSLLPFFAFHWSKPLGYYEPPALGEARTHAPERTATELEAAERWHVPALVPHDPHEHAPQRANLAPLSHDPQSGTLYPLGTDARGADNAAVWLHGFRSTLGVALTVAFVAAVLGLSLGLLAAALGGVVDALLTWMSEVLRLAPAVVLGLMILAFAPLTAQSANAWLIATLGLLLSGPIYRYVREEISSEAQRDYMQASRALGSSRLRRVVVHLAPTTLVPVLSGAGYAVAGAVAVNVTLEFFAVLPASAMPHGSWGGMLRDATDAGHAAPALLAGLAIAAVILVATLLGEALHRAERDAGPERKRPSPLAGARIP